MLFVLGAIWATLLFQRSPGDSPIHNQDEEPLDQRQVIVSLLFIKQIYLLKLNLKKIE